MKSKIDAAPLTLTKYRTQNTEQQPPKRHAYKKTDNTTYLVIAQYHDNGCIIYN